MCSRVALSCLIFTLTLGCASPQFTSKHEDTDPQVDASADLPRTGETDAGAPAKPGFDAGTATITLLQRGAFSSGAGPRKTGNLTVHDDGFETRGSVCSVDLCATGGLVP